MLEVFAVQDEITTAVTTGINPAVADAEQLRAMRKQPENLSAWEAYQRGRWHLEKFNETDNQKARTFLHRAITLDATFVPAFTAMGRAYLQEKGRLFPTGSLQASIGLATYWAGRAVEIDASDAEAHDVLVRAKLHEGISEESWRDMSLPLEISPNSSWAHSTRGMFLIFSGRPSQGRDELLTALRLSPRDPDNATPLILRSLSPITSSVTTWGQWRGLDVQCHVFRRGR